MKIVFFRYTLQKVEAMECLTEEKQWVQIHHQYLEQIGGKKWTGNARADEETEDVIHVGTDSSCDENDILSECQAMQQSREEAAFIDKNYCSRIVPSITGAMFHLVIECGSS